MNWYLIFTKPREEHRVTMKFKDAGINCYNPQIRRTTVRLNKKMTVTEPLFPRYLFVGIPLEDYYHKIKYTRGVVGFVDFGFGPVSVDKNIVEEIKKREIDGFINVIYRAEKFRKDDKLKIKRGLMKDLDVVFEKYLSSDERVSLLINNISSNIKLNIPKYYL